MESYLIRAKVDGCNMLHDMKEKQFVSIGFSNLPSLETYRKEEIRQLLTEQGLHIKRLNQLTLSVHHFVNKIAEGDYCLIPDPRKHDDIYLAQITSDYHYNAHQDYPHHRHITFLNDAKAISRAQLPEDVRKALHTNVTVRHLKQHHVYIHNLIQGLHQNKKYQYEKMKTNVPTVINRALESNDLKIQLQAAELALIMLEDWE